MTQSETPKAIEARLRAAMPDNISRRVQSARLAKGRAIIVADAGDMRPEEREVLEVAYRNALKGVEGVEEVRVALVADRKRMRIIAIGSGKGGVGKSTLTTNIAVALARQGHKVGVIDGDIYGPSQPKLLATENQKPEARGEKLIAIESPHGVKVLSMGHIVAPGKALAWRGPMAGKALGQLVQADWGDTDLLLIDLPPGTGDVQLSMMSDSKPDGAVLVSTPQDLALIDAARAGQLFEQGEIPIIGLVENMAGYECPSCGEVSDPFGQGGVEKFAKALEIPFLGRVPLRIETRLSGDSGKPPAATDGEGAVPFSAIAQRIAAWLSGEEF
ncbi:Mrp/NBP35 family ATP-binding protein [Erythrobacter sp. F6033]|uniref:Mrp/NBP35 family ATP-binding protein n=1 Tax=Erythrobacter sp. F6033 TaxID=2926401 RepID=UPI001FF2FC1B|nr:Mrp/NBP35 family ATP-binding protein [Erythrobacter sp. F6033]MCK0129378.1 Mrp/NBP35 family ATP-binding protein [Erythrobacter sp. F6033]